VTRSDPRIWFPLEGGWTEPAIRDPVEQSRPPVKPANRAGRLNLCDRILPCTHDVLAMTNELRKFVPSPRQDFRRSPRAKGLYHSLCRILLLCLVALATGPSLGDPCQALPELPSSPRKRKQRSVSCCQ